MRLTHSVRLLLAEALAVQVARSLARSTPLRIGDTVVCSEAYRCSLCAERLLREALAERRP